MNKKTNTILFICAATLFNIITFFAVFLALFLIFLVFSSKLLSDNGLSSLIAPIFIVIFVGAIALSFLIYRAVLGLFIRKVDTDQYFTPLFIKPKNAPKKMPQKEPAPKPEQPQSE